MNKNCLTRRNGTVGEFNIGIMAEYTHKESIYLVISSSWVTEARWRRQDPSAADFYY
jgi:hypothetical protein